jgi:hypothetical protein
MPTLYDQIGTTYSRYRRPDRRIVDAIAAALDGARTIVNVGSGTGSYEPRAPGVVAVEPSRTMIRQRSPGPAPVVQGVAEHLPFADRSFDTALAVLTTQHWADPAGGLAEMGRTAPRQVVLTWDPTIFARFWLVADYLPELAERERGLATLDAACAGLDVREVRAVPVPWDCTDGFCGAYWRRPRHYLDPGARAAISGIALLDQGAVDRAMGHLASDLDDGTWDTRYASLAGLDELDLGYRLVIAGR